VTALKLIKEDASRLKKLVRVAMAAGIVLALLCHLVPKHYRAICDAVATLCTGGS
jgi:hypothetical protein